MALFHSAVNRIPVLRDCAANHAEEGELPREIFTDHAAEGHDHLHAERWSGSIDLRLTAMTPIVFGEQERSETGQEAAIVGLPRDGDGRVIVPPTMIKGMLSRAYETLTASRFRVFEERTERLTYRPDTPRASGRREYSASPHDLARSQKVLPLGDREQASPADRLFGYVVPQAEEDAKGGDVALRGRIAVSAVDTEDVVVREKPRLLSPLLSPRPTSARRFLTDVKGRTLTRRGGGPLPRADYYAEGQQLGSAAYPVERKYLGTTGFPHKATKVHQDSGMEAPGPSVRLRVVSWIATGSVMRCALRFSDLSASELAALLWILTPENLVPVQHRQSDEAGFLRMGLGKPLGLGVVKVEIPDGGVRAVRGDDLAQSYRELNACLGLESAPASLPTLPSHVLSLLDRLPWVKAMQRAAYGYTDGVDVRYMSLEENKRNNLTEEGLPREGGGVSPRDLVDDPRPIDTDLLPSKQRRNHAARAHRGAR
ncbi:hypothetical protein ACSL103130_08670 [Actinomyces slackii]|uniref:CRISPR-associated protein n=1 Tax=Actinomyces slackii TaxID=52774 RepID=A0A3S4SNS8_9ACTO|nr:hypothetical protein [Actinomyces slackii]VEG74359.1 CRISPR-associated protein [Actinomyces slackii]